MLNSIQKAIDFIEENIYSDLKVETIAEQVYMSPFHFQRLFTVVCGVSVGEYIRNRRLTLAGIDVETTNERIIDIALKYQYESPESFSRAFTRFHGLSPMAARNQKGHIKSITKIFVESIIGGKNIMQKLNERGYAVKENGPVYYTKDMDKTAKWFEEVLGWYTGIDQRNDSGEGVYGCILPFPFEVSSITLAPFTGIHMFYGEPSNKVVAFMRVDNIENLYAHVKRSGWNQIGEITKQPWGGKECCVTTVDGGELKFFQLDE
ncbi:MAG: helix-turn-helix domain-containing protein [Lachnospiraceae bacterium]|nr:helix-turn-helix domain-containing protein [Lachnospiraceae bacterium]